MIDEGFGLLLQNITGLQVFGVELPENFLTNTTLCPTQTAVTWRCITSKPHYVLHGQDPLTINTYQVDCYGYGQALGLKNATAVAQAIKNALTGGLKNTILNDSDLTVVNQLLRNPVWIHGKRDEQTFVHSSEYQVWFYDLHLDIVNIAFDASTYSLSTSPAAYISVTFDQEVSWTNSPALNFTANGYVYQAVAVTSSPATTIVFELYWANYQNTFSAGALSYGNGPWPAMGTYFDYLTVVANDPGPGGNFISFGIANMMTTADTESGYAAIPNTALNVIQSSNSILVIGATDADGNPASTVSDIITAVADSLSGSYVTVESSQDPTTIVPVTNSFSGALYLSWAGGYVSADPSALGGGLNAFAGNSITQYGASTPVFTFTNSSGSPSLVFNPNSFPLSAINVTS